MKKSEVFPGRPFWKRALLFLAILSTVLFLFRYPILRAMGNYLDVGIEPTTMDAVYILGGSPHDRGLHALTIYADSLCRNFICTGGNTHGTLIAYGVDMRESELTARFLENQGVPANFIRALSGSTSTYEESLEIWKDCKDKGYGKIGVLSSAYHTRRVRWIFERQFENSGVEVCILSAPPTNYDPAKWWESENGMLFFFNEIVKIGYYRLKY